jgi:4-amino-4-deoxy-L-arabinose transferase-like glycosyltransferase
MRRGKSVKQIIKKPVYRFEFIILFIICIIALGLRLWKLSITPWGFHVDELDAGYVGRYIWLHGKDIFGHSWPLYFNKFGDYRPTAIFYLSGLSTFIFGINEFAVRFPAALFGAITVIPFFYLVKYVSGKNIPAFIAAALLAISPWHIVLSRATSEPVVGLFFFITGLGFYLRGLEWKTLKPVMTGVFFLICSYFCYHLFRLVVPLILIPPLFWKSPAAKNHIRATLICTGFFALSAVFLFSSGGSGRLSQVAFFRNPSLNNTFMSLAYGDGANHVTTVKIFHNKPVVYAREFMTQYLSYFSPQFLFLNGGAPERYTVPYQGLFYLILAPFFLLGLVTLIKIQIPTRMKYFILFLLFITPLPAALTFDDAPNVHRSLTLILPLIILMAFGIDYLICFVKRKNIRIGAGILIVLLLTAETVYFWHQYSVHSPSYKSVLRNDGSKQLAAFLGAHSQDYENITVPASDETALYYLFYTRNFSLIPEGTFPEKIYTADIGNIHFVKSDCPDGVKKINPDDKRKLLMVDKGDCQRPATTNYTDIMRRDSTYAYRLIR